MRVLDKVDRITKFLSVGKKMKDSIPIGFLGGLMGTIAMGLSNIFSRKLDLAKKPMPSMQDLFY